MRRREVIALIGGAAVWPIGAGAQQGLPVIGVLGSTSLAEWAHPIDAFREGLAEAGLIEGRHVAIEFRWARNQFDLLPALAAELVARQVDVIFTTGGTISALTAKAATSTIPVVFIIGADPVRLGLVASLNRPGGNVTGVTALLNSLVAKRLQLMRELVPAATAIGLLVNPKNPNAESDTRDVETAARALGLKIHVANASIESEFAPAFSNFVGERVGAMLILPDPLFLGRRDEITALATRHALPAMYDRRELAVASGLISYGPSFTDANRQAGIYTARIIKGERPADLPVVQPTKFELVVNLRTARALNLTIPPTLLARADEVIE